MRVFWLLSVLVYLLYTLEVSLAMRHRRGALDSFCCFECGSSRPWFRFLYSFLGN
ncbi:hypothetical protein HMPREF1544_04500 [Mucor circinelloides 1006PhL]|uniref:Uncharacterized protein n=1 Tax=Mucor circinelloides f. circinelloides (strain 1006PhL) TaxID=1220926 RepID=S2K0E6_MUCC1|nr:hypothetical protein HMPREF1544_04500 [Mucor circinelloides 1006PhL]